MGWRGKWAGGEWVREWRAALKAGQPWVAAAELSRLGGQRLLADLPGSDEQKGCLIAPSVSQEESVNYGNSPVTLWPGLGFLPDSD